MQFLLCVYVCCLKVGHIDVGRLSHLLYLVEIIKLQENEKILTDE